MVWQKPTCSVILYENLEWILYFCKYCEVKNLLNINSAYHKIHDNSTISTTKFAITLINEFYKSRQGCDIYFIL